MSILDSAEALYRAKNYSGSGDWLDEVNSHDAQFGTGTPGTNDPLAKDLPAEQYIYSSGVDGNYISVPDSAALSITGDIDIRWRGARPDWSPSSAWVFAKWGGGGSRSYFLGTSSFGNIAFQYRRCLHKKRQQQQ